MTLLRNPLRNPLRRPLRPVDAVERTGFSAASWFTSGEQGGVWESYNPDSIVRRRNLLTWSEDLSRWSGNGATLQSNTDTAPDGTLSADRIVEDGTTGSHRGITTGAAFVAGRSYTFSCFMRQGPRRYGQLGFPIAAFTTGGGISVDLQTGVIVQQSASMTAAGVIDAGGGWWRCWATRPCDVTTTSTPSVWTAATSGEGVGTGHAGDSVSYISAWGAQIEAGALTDYQKVTDWNTEFVQGGGTRVSLWQDPNGITPVTAVEQTVGRRLDMRLGGVRGSPLTFQSSSAPIGSNIDNGDGTYTISAGGNGRFNFALAELVNGQSYEVAFTVISGAGAVLADWCDQPSGGASFTAVPGLAARFIGERSTYDNTMRFVDVSGPAGGPLTITRPVVRAVPGNHSTQATAASRGVLRARYNLAVATEDATNAAWIKNDVVVTANQATAPNGQQTLDAVVDGVGGTSSLYEQVAGLVAGSPVTFSLTLKRGDHDWMRLTMANVGVTTGASVWFNLATGTKGATNVFGTASGITGSITPEANGCWRLTISGVFSTADTTVQCYNISATADGSSVRVNGGTRYVGYIEVRPTADAALAIPSYQAVRTATDYDTDGFPHYIARDGIDDSDATAAINATAGNKVTVITGMTKLSEAIFGIVVEFSPNADANNGSFYVAAPLGTNGNNFSGAMKADGTLAGVGGTVNTYPAPSSVVLAYEADLGAPMQKLWIDGAVKQTNPASTGAGNFGNWPLFFGRRNGSSSPVTARDYGVIVCFASRTPEQIVAASRSMASKMGRVLP